MRTLNAFLKTLPVLLPLLLALQFDSFAQAPKIFYPSNPYIKNFTLNSPVIPFAPSNSGGEVPAIPYGAVSTYAGLGDGGYRDGTVANALFLRPSGLTIDAAGNIYVADTFNHRIRKIATDGTVTTIAGGPAVGRTNGNGNAARFNQPFSLALNSTGDLFVADSYNNQIRKISPSGDVTLFSGNPNGLPGFDDGPASAADFDLPVALAFDTGGDLFVADAANNTVRKITPTGDVTVFAGLSRNRGYVDGKGRDARFWQPAALTFDAEGNLFTTDYFNHVIRMIDPYQNVTTFAGDHTNGSANGPRMTASFQLPTGLAVDRFGNLYVSDDNDLIRKISKTTGEVTIVAGSGAKGSDDGQRFEASFYHPIGLAFDHAGNLYVADEHNNKIRKIDLAGGYSIDKPLPAGLIFDPATGVISGTPTVTSPPTDYTVTGYNRDGESSAVVKISVTDPNIVFGPIPAKNICDVDFDPGARGPAGSVLSYTSDNPAVATITADQKIHINGPGTANITVTDGDSRRTQPFTVNDLPKPTVNISPEIQTGCEGAALTFNASVKDAGNSPSYRWQVNGQDGGEDSPIYTSSVLKTGDLVTCTVTNTDGFCIPVSSSPSNSVSVKVVPNRIVSVAIRSSATQPVCPGVPITFRATPSVGLPTDYSYIWTVNESPASTTSSEFTTDALNNKDVVACTILSDQLCITPVSAGTEDRMMVSLLPISLCEVDIPNAFSPNQDGINDTWSIPSLVSYPSCKVQVHNRLGEVIFQSFGYKVPWDGNHRGKPLPTGTYYYLITINSQQEKRSGPITIIR